MGEQNLTKDLHLMVSTTPFLKKGKINVLGDYVLSNSKVTNYVIKKCKQKQLAEFECSKDNILHSIATYYTSGVMGRRKYQAARLASSMKSSDLKRG